MYEVSPRQREKLYLRLLLLHVRGAKSFQDIKTVNSVVYPTYFEAAKERNLISSDQKCDKCLNELFAYI